MDRILHGGAPHYTPLEVSGAAGPDNKLTEICQSGFILPILSKKFGKASSGKYNHFPVKCGTPFYSAKKV